MHANNCNEMWVLFLKAQLLKAKTVKLKYVCICNNIVQVFSFGN